MSRKMKVPLNLLTLSSDPVTGSLGDIYVNTVTKNIRVYNGDAWIDLTPASTNPTPFYMHTHTYDGEVDVIDVENPVTFTEFNTTAITQEELPVIIGIDGGSPNDSVTNPQYSNLTLLDGGTVGN